MEKEETVEETPHSSNIASSEIDSETVHKLRGDAIGDTMYSEVFVLNTLIQFSDLKWNSEVEDNLCFLWDMTEEKDVSQYLFQLSYPELACTAVTKYNEPRFIEIVVGIFANILCSNCAKNVKDDEITTIINIIDSNDPYILIQVMRFIHAVSFMFHKLPFITEEHVDRLNFILDNSTNKELLVLALKVLSAITDDTKVDQNVVKGELLTSSITAYKVIKGTFDCESEFEIFGIPEHQAVIKHLIQFVCNICSYIDNLKVVRLVDELNLYIHEFTHEMSNFLDYVSCLPIDDEGKFYIEALSYIYKMLGVKYTSTIVLPLCKIMFELMEENSDYLEVCAELFCYFVSVGSFDYFKNDFKDVPLKQLKTVLVHLDRRQFKFEFDYASNLSEILNQL